MIVWKNKITWKIPDSFIKNIEDFKDKGYESYGLDNQENYDLFLSNLPEDMFTMGEEKKKKIELERNKNELLSFLKAELKNNNIKIHIKVNKLKEKTFIYSSVEKYEKLKKINPRIESLRKEFKLNL